MVPESGASRPARQRSRVLLPEPLRPVTSRTSPVATDAETPPRTARRPKRRRTWAKLKAGGMGSEYNLAARPPPWPAGVAWPAMRGRLPLRISACSRSPRGGRAARGGLDALAVPGTGARLVGRLARILRVGPVLAALGAVLAGAGASGLPAASAASAAGGGGRGSAAPPDLPVMRPPDLELRAMLLLVAERRVYEPLTVMQALKAGPETRAELAAALGRIPGQEAGSVLAGLLIDDQAEVRRAAAFSLGLRGDAAARPALRQAMLDPDRETGALAVEALGRLATPLVEVAEQLLKLPEEERWPRLLPYLFRFKDEALVPLAE